MLVWVGRRAGIVTRCKHLGPTARGTRLSQLDTSGKVEKGLSTVATLGRRIKRPSDPSLQEAPIAKHPGQAMAPPASDLSCLGSLSPAHGLAGCQNWVKSLSELRVCPLASIRLQPFPSSCMNFLGGNSILNFVFHGSSSNGLMAKERHTSLFRISTLLSGWVPHL